MARPNLSKDDRARHCGNPTKITSVVSAAAPGLETIMVSRARLPLSDSKSTPAAAPPRLLHQRTPLSNSNPPYHTFGSSSLSSLLAFNLAVWNLSICINICT
ncbi:hypothetical protein TNIN_388681 [Trichonephila inaurata madagascariensis]|uniref:Uncharacterized protein n=1 Tax=Trichonephila inaurata madagascariensis TaxID=2747483 RepID=A0A8X6J4R6_9ARAC|nr:hypothetical protein TNIN_388681 [Trichonephila inaurata madagascariensis]